METTIYTQAGKENGKLTLPEAVFGVAWNPTLVHDVVVAMQSNARTSAADTKGRGDVRGGGKKPWKQKGTGRARHGSSRSPMWVGGGVSHGPTNEKDYTKKINKKVRQKALASTLSKKLTDNEVVFVDSFDFSAPKAADAKTVLLALASGSKREDLFTKRKNATLLVLTERNEVVEKSFRNFGNVLVTQVKDINPVDLLSYKYVVFASPKQAVEILEQRIN